jgi:hypothetical protein
VANTLLDIQRAIQRTISEAKLSGFEEIVKNAPPLSSEDRVLIYINAYFSRLAEALEKDFKFTYQVIGKDNFNQFVTGYLQEHPSHSPTIADLGESLEKYLKTWRHLDEHPHLADLAKVEWHHLMAFYANDLPPLDMTKLEALSPEDWKYLVITIDPSVHILKCGWNFAPLFQGEGQDIEKHPPEQGETYHLIYRKDDQVHLEVISEVQAQLLQGFQNQLTLENVCEYVETKETPIGQWFSDWMEKGIFKDISISEPFTLPCTD